MTDHTPMMPMETHAMCGSEIHATSVPKTLFKRPNCWLYSHFHTIATAAGAQTIGRKKMVRNTEVPLSFLLRNTASTSAITTPKGTSMSAYLMVFHRECQVSPAVKTLA